MTDFAKEVNELWTAAEEADKDNRDEAMLDLEFAALKQWDSRTRRQREERGGNLPPLPCLTIDITNQLVGQVVGDRRANQTSIKVLPREDGDKQVAEVRSELIRSIELQSKAPRVYAQAFEQAVTCGIGNFRVDLDYAYEDAFERDLFIRGIANPMSVLWDPMAGDPTGRDASYCFVQERIRNDEYEARFGEKPTMALNDSASRSGGWIDGETVRVAELWKMTEKDKLVGLTVDGKTVDITGTDPASFQMIAGPDGSPLFTDGQILLAVNPAKNEPYIRETKCKYATRILTNGKEQLEEPLELKIPRVPIIRVMGREIWVGDERIRFGLIRPIRDQQRLKNYLRSIAAQKLMFAPRYSFLIEEGSIDGREQDYGPDVLTYKKNAQPPQEATQNNLAAIVQMSEMFNQDMMNGSGIHEASRGMRSNETSGRAILARQHEGDIATIIYHDNMNAAQQEAGEVINALIPSVFDTMRTIRTVGEDDSTKLVEINNPNNPDAVDLAQGKYDVAVSTGPAYMTKRLEAATIYSDLILKAPELRGVAGDLMIKAMDLPDGDKFADRVKKTINPALLEGEEEPTPEQMQAKAAAEAEEAEMKGAAKRKLMAEVAEAEAKARKAIKEAEDAEAGINKQTVDAKNAETAQIRAIVPKGVPLTPEAASILAPLIANAVVNALQSPDVLPLSISAEIAESAFDQAEDERVRGAMPPPQNPNIEGELQ